MLKWKVDDCEVKVNTFISIFAEIQYFASVLRLMLALYHRNTRYHDMRSCPKSPRDYVTLLDVDDTCPDVAYLYDSSIGGFDRIGPDSILCMHYDICNTCISVSTMGRQRGDCILHLNLYDGRIFYSSPLPLVKDF